VSSEQRAAIDIAKYAKLAAQNHAPSFEYELLVCVSLGHMREQLVGKSYSIATPTSGHLLDILCAGAGAERAEQFAGKAC
jgi:hypothetical protein